jgi:Tol biopolymer transport system component
VSPDGAHVILRKVATYCALWLLDATRGTLSRVVHDHDAHGPAWAPDSRRIAYLQADTGKLVVRNTTGMPDVRTLAEGAEAGEPASWSANGDRLAYVVSGRTTHDDIWLLAVDGSSPPAPFLATEFNETSPAFSPDGKWIAYVSDESGKAEVFARSYPDRGEAWQISTDGGRSPVWSPDGKEIFFVFGNKMMTVPIETRSGFSAGSPMELFETDLGATITRDFDVAPDGRFIAVRREGGSLARRQVRVLLSWPHELSGG